MTYSMVSKFWGPRAPKVSRGPQIFQGDPQVFSPPDFGSRGAPKNITYTSRPSIYYVIQFIRVNQYLG